MATRLSIPELGENIHNGRVVSVLVGVGDDVTEGQAVLELETGKAVVEVPAARAGTVAQVLVAQDDEVEVGQAFLALDEKETQEASPPEPDLDTATPAAEPEEPSPVAEPSEAPGEGEKDSGPPTPTPAARALGQELDAGTRHVPAAPSVRRFAREIGIDVDTVDGSGPRGRVSIEDVKRHAREQRRRGLGAGGAVLPPLPDFARWGSVRRERMSAIRLATAEQVTRSWNAIPRVTHFDQADITQLDALRRRYADRADALGGKLTMAVMVVKVAAAALRLFPKLNASVDMQAREVVYKDYVNIGIAVATDRGLMVPVVRDADKKNMVQLAAEITRVAQWCRDGKVTPEDLEGATFTVTNLGRIGGTFFTPIVNHPEVAILGMGRAAEAVVPRDGEIVVRTLLPLSLSYDHRLIDGADAAAFVRWIADAVEEPLLLSLEG
jgi:pyruvate dehydrogenase E2 component (dihydrolipoamide acetyltransferase)